MNTNIPAGWAQKAIATALDALRENHKWHQDYDEHDDYPESKLAGINENAIALLEAAQHPVDAVPGEPISDERALELARRITGARSDVPSLFGEQIVKFARLVQRATPTAPQAVGEPVAQCPDCKGSEFVGFKRGLRCSTCDGTGLVAIPSDDPIRALIAKHAEFVADDGKYPYYCYFELAYTRSTGWMAWLCSKPSVDDPGRKVITRGQGTTPDDACRNALSNLKDDA